MIEWRAAIPNGGYIVELDFVDPEPGEGNVVGNAQAGSDGKNIVMPQPDTPWQAYWSEFSGGANA
jgi:hypothetical protein